MPKVILISGGSDGLGKAMAKKLAPNNQVIILAHNKSKLEAAAKEINCDFVEAELTDYSSIKTAVNEVISKYQKIDVLINNAGVWVEGGLEENDPDKIKEVIGINSLGTILLTKAVLPYMRSTNSGLIINIISQDGLSSKKNRSVYHASKWAITGFTRCLQDDLEDLNIKVTAVYPGLIKTKLFEKNGVQRDLTNALEPAEVALQIENVINLNSGTYIPELSIKNKLTTPNMDNSTSPTIDLNIDPNMIAAQDDTPQATMPVEPVTPILPVKNPGVIDITPGSTDTFPSDSPVSSHIGMAPASEPTIQEPVPQTPASDSLSHLSDITPEPAGEPIPDEPAPVAPSPVIESVAAPVVAEPTPVQEPVPPAAPVAPVVQEPVPQTPVASPIAEDPDLVKLVK